MSEWTKPSDPDGPAIVHPLEDLREETGTYGKYWTGNRDITDYSDKQKQNAVYLWAWGKAKGYTLEAISGMAGNMTRESHIDPGRWQKVSSGMTKRKQGYGLVQWTPYWKYGDWCEAQNLYPPKYDSALARIEYEIANNEQWIPTKTYNLTFNEYLHTSNQTIEWMAKAFFYNYERGSDASTRVKPAQYWYEYLGGVTPTPPGKTTLPIWLLKKCADNQRMKGGILL